VLVIDPMLRLTFFRAIHRDSTFGAFAHLEWMVSAEETVLDDELEELEEFFGLQKLLRMIDLRERSSANVHLIFSKNLKQVEFLRLFVAFEHENSRQI
jgi:hypothetical protein